MWRCSVGNFQRSLAAISERGIFHGIDDDGDREIRASTDFVPLIDNRVGVIGACRNPDAKNLDPG